VIRAIDDKRKEPDYNPIRIAKYNDSEIITNFDDMYESRKEIIIEAKDLLSKFVVLIKEAFEPIAIQEYLKSHPV